MKEQINNAIEWIKEQDVEGVITGSCLLDYYEGQDIDIFTYNESAFTKLIYSMYHNPMFLLMDPIEKWKFKDWTESTYRGSLKKLGLVSIKMVYNTCVNVNIIFKENKKSIFDVLASFDMDIIAKGYDLKTKKILDLSEGREGIATWNKWNKSFYNVNIWSMNQLLRQFERIIKYHKRGYNTDEITLKYKEILKDMMEYENIFNSAKVDEKVEIIKKNGIILNQILDKWLETHELTESETELLNLTIKELR
jgi:hypothetical protein